MWLDKETGKNLFSTQIRGDRLRILGSRVEPNAAKAPAKKTWGRQPKVSDPLGLVKSVEESPSPF